VTDKTRVAVVGGGWAGLAAAVEASLRGHHVTLFEMAGQLGGRSRELDVNGVMLDNGQHILIGAYTQTLRLMRIVGVDIAEAFVRTPLRITDVDGLGLRLNPGAPVPAFAAAVCRHPTWKLPEKVALLRATGAWALRGFDCEPALTVANLTARLPLALRDGLIDPLCVAALNTPATDASAAVFLRVLKDALFSGPGSSDLLLPRVSLSECFPTPAARWLAQEGAVIRLRERVEQLHPREGAWLVNGSAFDHVVLATTPTEAASLAGPVCARWARLAAALRYEPIVTVYLHSAGARLPEPMLALRSDAQSPAQFVFDRGQLGGPPGLLAFVVSGAQPWLDLGIEATKLAVVQQASRALKHLLREPAHVLRTITEKRATFRCTPGLPRPAMQIAAGLNAAGDHVQGPYPATLEGAVLCGVCAAREIARRGTRAGSPD